MESTAARDPLSVAPNSLAAAFAEAPEPRRAASVVYPLPAILAMTVAALLANHCSVLAIAEWGARQEPSLLAALGFPEARTPCQSTLHRLFSQLDGDALAALLTRCFAPSARPSSAEQAAQGIAIDGKAQRGRRRFAAGGGVVHALSAFCHDVGLVLAHEPITTNADKTEAELTVAPTLLTRLDWHGRVLTGDALFCQTALCEQVIAAGGDYLFVVKANQGTLYRDIQLLFDPPGTAACLTDGRVTRTIECGHGRSLERRELIASTDLTDYLDWPGARQVFRLERTWREHGQPKRALHYGITSLAPDHADAAQLLALRRGHWTIENRLHRHKDVALDEDASLIHVGQGPTVMALLRDAALNLLHAADIRRIAPRLRAYSQHPEQAVALVLGPLPARA
jgi:predicted transposase YbfD/YdcC